MTAIVVLGAVILALLWLLDRQQKRHHEQLSAHRLETAGILERVRSPELAKPEPKIEHVEEVPAVAFDDDHGFWEAKGVTSGDTR